MENLAEALKTKRPASKEPEIPSKRTRIDDEHIPKKIADDKQLAANLEDDQEICFGSVCDVPIRFFARSSESHWWEKVSFLQVFQHLQLAEFGPSYAVTCSTRNLASVETNISKALRALDTITTVRKELDGDLESFSDCMEKLSANKKPGHWMVEILLFGKRADKESVGNMLSKARIYLDRPRKLPEDTILENPHFLNLPGALYDEEIGLENTRSNARENKAQSPTVFAEVLSDLDQTNYLEKVSADSRIISSLTDHQRQGVDFILKREKILKSQPSFSLWKEWEDGRYGTRSIHRVTNRPSLVCNEVAGGLIADEMGLGKTLTMLSAMAMTQERSRAFAESYESTSKIASRATLIVVPSILLLDNWVNEITKHFSSSTFIAHRYHGQKKQADAQNLSDNDIVITTYGTLTSDASGKSPVLSRVNWFRVVLDEAHIIRNSGSKVFRAAVSLPSKFRWCLTGTPIQNNLEDLASLVRFLRVPFLEKSADFRLHCIRPTQNGILRGVEAIRTLLSIICLRRTKDLLHLPEPHMIEYKLTLSKQERALYSALNQEYKNLADEVICGKRSGLNTSIFRILLKLRLTCNHGIACGTATPEENEKESLMALLQDGSTSCANCGASIHFDGGESKLDLKRFSACGHVLCATCVRENNLKKSKSTHSVCLVCSVSSERTPTPDITEDIIDTHFKAQCGNEISTKILKVIEDLKKHRSNEKCIIFSYWKKTLDLLSGHLSKNNFPFVQLDGSMSFTARQVALKEFCENDDMTLLMTLGTGAVGLNLTIATRIHILEPQWNPTIESQAIGRAIRIGQTKQVSVVRYIMRNTVEEYIQALQLQKDRLANLGFQLDHEKIYSNGMGP